jgi:hypothetical protein
VEVQGAVYGPEAGGSVTRHYKEGTIRIELEGYRIVERLVRFRGSPIALTIALHPATRE